MKDLPRIEAAYTRLDSFLEQSRSSAKRADLERLDAEQVLNDQAFFLLCWGQIEVEIDEACRAAIRRGRTASDWNVRRAWDFSDPDHKRLSGLVFENRAVLVLDRQAGRGAPYAKVMMHYETRNSIAHGKLRLTRIDMAEVIQDFYLVQAALHRSL